MDLLRLSEATKDEKILGETRHGFVVGCLQEVIDFVMEKGKQLRSDFQAK